VIPAKRADEIKLGDAAAFLSADLLANSKWNAAPGGSTLCAGGPRRCCSASVLCRNG